MELLKVFRNENIQPITLQFVFISGASKEEILNESKANEKPFFKNLILLSFENLKEDFRIENSIKY